MVRMNRSTITATLKRWRENYYCSLLLAGIARPPHFICKQLAAQIQTKVRKNGVTIRLPNGHSMSIGRDAGIEIASVLFWHGLDGYERKTSETLRFFFAWSSTFVDVGANCGLYSILAALWNPQIKVVAFEPFPPIFEYLKKNVSLNDLDNRVVCERLALSSQSGIDVFHIPQSDRGEPECTGTLARNSWQVRQGSPCVQVETVRFDDYERSHPMRVDLMKIDVEDFEADVLEGMHETIERDRPFIICEILPRNKQHRNERTRQVIEALNYTPYWITDSGYVRVSRFDFERKDTEFLLSPISTSNEIVDDLSQLLELRRRAADG